ncbi:hypothetical protein GGI07_003153 [Coemansia sp. Benny D115]|nr:hypothetical protein GGI07_003153 [Coemansia sp. Benny D115]
MSDPAANSDGAASVAEGGIQGQSEGQGGAAVSLASTEGAVNSTSLPMQIRIPGGMDSTGATRESIDVAVVSLARYTFADPAMAEAGPAPLEPLVERPRLLGVDQPPVSALTVHRTVSTVSSIYEDDGLIADFTEDRCNRQLSLIAKRLLLPDTYTAACYDLHQFLDTNMAMLSVESVQRNVFKCLKICARLSKLHGYSIQLMWQVIQQAYKMIDCFTPERANTIGLWNVKLSNRIRLMAVTPAADGSAPPRLPSMPPRELLQAQARNKLLPLPEMSVSALNDANFNRNMGISSASYYLNNTLENQRMRRIQAQSESESQSQGQSQGQARELVQNGGGESAPVQGLTPDTLAGQDIDLVVQRAAASRAESTSIDAAGAIAAANTASSPLSRSISAPEESTAESSDSGGALTVLSSAADSSTSSQEVELAIIEHQLRELESMPAHSMGPMLRAALNLLVEMRFRLQLGLPRNTISEGAQGSGGGQNQTSLSNSPSAEVFGAGANNESRAIEYVLNQISTSRRRMIEQQQQAANILAARGALAPGAGFGAPLYMLQHHQAAMLHANENADGLMAMPHLDWSRESMSMSMSPAPALSGIGRPHGTRRRRDTETSELVEDDGEGWSAMGNAESGATESMQIHNDDVHGNGEDVASGGDNVSTGARLEGRQPSQTSRSRDDHRSSRRRARHH